MTLGRLFSNAFSTFKNINMDSLRKNRFIWIDLELTGLDVNKDTVLEIACIVTTTDLNLVHEGLSIVVHQPDDVLASMNEWSLVNHTKSGLTQASRESTIDLREAEKKIVNYIKQHSDPEGTRYIAGNSVYMDKCFINKHMPAVDSLLHYRILDVSSLKILFNHWYPEEFLKLPEKNLTHRAFDDILESIKELKNFRSAFFKK